jgi:hypothetical protein
MNIIGIYRHPRLAKVLLRQITHRIQMGFNNGIGIKRGIPAHGLIYSISELRKEGEVDVFKVIGDVLYEVLFVVGDADEKEEVSLQRDNCCMNRFNISNLRLQILLLIIPNYMPKHLDRLFKHLIKTLLISISSFIFTFHTKRKLLTKYGFSSFRKNKQLSFLG